MGRERKESVSEWDMREHSHAGVFGRREHHHGGDAV